MTLEQCLFHLRTLANSSGGIEAYALMDTYVHAYLASATGKPKAELADELRIAFLNAEPVTPLVEMMIGRLAQIGRESAGA